MEQLDNNIVTKNKIDFSELKKWRVIFHNDDKTTVDFVIGVLMEIFNYSNVSATEITMKIHDEGKSTVGVYTYEIAQQKASDTLEVAEFYDFPLNVTIERNE